MAGPEAATGVGTSPNPNAMQGYTQADIDQFNGHLAQAASPPPQQPVNQELSQKQLDDLRGQVNFVFPKGQDGQELPQEKKDAYLKDFDKSMSYLSHSDGWDKIQDRLFNPGDRGKLTIVLRDPPTQRSQDGRGSDQNSTTTDSRKVYWNPHEAVVRNGQLLSPAASLGHEIGGHASYTVAERAAIRARETAAKGGSYGAWPTPKNDQQKQDQNYIVHYNSVEEAQVIFGYEQPRLLPGLNAYRQYKHMQGVELTRTDYEGGPKEVDDVLCADQSCLKK